MSRVSLGAHATLLFEDRLTIQYQIQEMLRVERIFEASGIEEELAAYNPLIPDGQNLKVTFLIEYEDAEERRQALQKLIDIEDKVWMQVDGLARVWAIADEDLERETEEKTSTVHFLRFEFSAEMVAAAKKGSPIAVGIVESNDPHGPFGAKEAGEGSLAAFLPALTNAIADATGLRFNDLPVTPDRVFAALEKRARRAPTKAGGDA